MSDETQLQAIEKRLDPETSRGLALSGSAGTFSIAPRNMGELMEFAKLMALSGPCVRPAFRGKVGACLAIALQAFRTGADPFAVANKAYITTSRSGDEQIAYEAQYIHAVVNGSGQLLRRLRARYSGQGDARKCLISGYVRGEEEALEYESPPIGQIVVKNSPLWKGDPDQQLFYYSTRAWARRHLPEVIMGMYTPDEVETLELQASEIRTVPLVEAEPQRGNAGLRAAMQNARNGGDGDGTPDLRATMNQPAGRAGAPPEPPEQEPDSRSAQPQSKGAADDGPNHPVDDEGGNPAAEPAGNGWRLNPADFDADDPRTPELPPVGNERDEFWFGAKLAVQPVLNAKGNRTDWPATKTLLLRRIDEAQLGELDRLEADNHRTLEGLRHAYVGLYDEVLARLADRRAELEGAS